MKIDVMTKDKNIKTVVPALRFPEFRDGEGWKRTPILEICEIIGGGTPSSSNDVYWNGDIPWISSSDINENNISEITPTRHITKDAIKHSATKLCKAPSIHIVSRVGVGKVAFSRVDICTSQDFTNLCNINCNYIFLSYLLSTIMKQKVQETQGTSIKGIASAEIKNLHVPLPEIEEQQRIADCLSSLDDLISAVADKIETLEEYKKGLMQQLFPAEGKTIPAIRFPEFQNAPDWQETALENIGEIVTGNTPSTKEPNNYGGDRLFVSPADISDKRYVSQTKTTLSEKGFRLSRHIKENSILFVCIGSTIGKVAQNTRECATNQQINSIMPYKGHVADFVYSILEHYAPQIASIAGNQAVPIINKTLFSSVSLLMPKENEQQKIADCLSSVDELISTETAKLDQLKNHKKGLMQQLFPKLQ